MTAALSFLALTVSTEALAGADAAAGELGALCTIRAAGALSNAGADVLGAGVTFFATVGAGFVCVATVEAVV